MVEEATTPIEIESTNPVARWFGVVTEPTKTFASIARRPTWVVAVLFVAVIAIALGHVFAPIGIDEAKERILSNPNITEEQRDAILERFDQAGSLQNVILWRTAAPLVVTFIVFFVIAGANLFSANLLFGGSASYKQVLAVNAWSAAAVVVFASAVKGGIGIAKQTTRIATSLAALPVAEPRSFLYAFLDKFDLFNVWGIVLGTIGIAAAAKLKTGSAAWAVLVPYLVWWTLTLFLQFVLHVNFGFGM